VSATQNKDTSSVGGSGTKAEFMYSREKWYELTSTRLGRDLRFCFGVITVFNVFN
jgi:hypothetical protein